MIETTRLGPDVNPKLKVKAIRIGSPTKQSTNSIGGSAMRKPRTESFEAFLTSKLSVMTAVFAEVTWFFALSTTYFGRVPNNFALLTWNG